MGFQFLILASNNKGDWILAIVKRYQIRQKATNKKADSGAIGYKYYLDPLIVVIILV